MQGKVLKSFHQEKLVSIKKKLAHWQQILPHGTQTPGKIYLLAHHQLNKAITFELIMPFLNLGEFHMN